MSNSVYLSLGTNVGDRSTNLKRTAALIDSKIGTIIKRSAIYQTAAWGIEDQQDFLNQVVLVETNLLPEEMLYQTQQIEQEIGRKQTYKWGPRVIDIDILLIDDLIIDTDALQVPHPEIQNRRFILVPLAQLAAAVKHPTLNISIEELLTSCPDKLPVQPVQSRHIAIEGNIGAGKTTLADQLAVALNGTLLLERFEENPYLEDFYAEAPDINLKLELFFLEDRYRQLSAMDTSELVISDFTLHKSLVFAEVNLSEGELEEYRRAYRNIARQIPKPDIVVFLDKPVTTLQQQIKQRGRSYEQQIPDSYLQQVARSYDTHLDDLGNRILRYDEVSALNDIQALIQTLITP